MKMTKRLISLLLIILLLVPALAQASVPKLDDLLKAALQPAIHVDVLNEGEGGYGQWKKGKDDMFQFRCKVYNHHETKKVKAFELYLYADDVWGDPVYGEGVYYYHTTTKKINPGSNVYSDYFNVPDCSQIAAVYVGVKRVIYTDDTVEEVPDVDYGYWEIEW